MIFKRKKEVVSSAPRAEDVPLNNVENVVNVYVIQDRLSGVFSEPIFKVNHAVMQRYFANICAHSPEARPCDYDLYVIGTYDCKKAILYPLQEKEYLMNGVDLNEEK